MTATWRDWAKAVGLRNRLSEAVSGFTPSCLCWRKAVSRQRRLRTPISDRLFRLDAGFADHVAPAQRLFLDESARLRRRAAAGADAQRRKALTQARILHRGIGGSIKLGDELGRYFRRRGERMPRVGNAAVHPELFQRRNIRQ